MSSKTRLCTCRKFCQAPPGGKLIALRTWYSHAAQHLLEEGITLSEREAQERLHPRRRNKVGSPSPIFDQSSGFLSIRASVNTTEINIPLETR